MAMTVDWQPRSAATYLLPYQTAGELSETADLPVTQSLRLTIGTLQTDRYFVPVKLAPAAPDRHLGLVTTLCFPGEARELVDRQLGGWDRLGALGAAWDGELCGYRAYFRSGIERPGEVYGWGIDWIPGRSAFSVKTYTLLSADDPQATADLVRGSLKEPDGSTEQQITESWLELLDHLCGRLQLLEVRDLRGTRSSFDVAPAWEEPLRLEQLRTIGSKWLSLFGLSSSTLNQFDRFDGNVVNLALGRDNHGVMFASIYHGTYPRPAAVVPPPSSRPLLEEDDHTESLLQRGKVFAIGRIGYDSGDDTTHTAFVDLERSNAEIAANDASRLQSLLAAKPELASRIAWTFEIGGTAVYRIAPAGAFAESSFAALVEFFHDQMEDDLALRVERVSLAGTIVGSHTLSDGRRVAVVRPVVRGLRSWSTRALMGSLDAGRLAEVAQFLERLYEERRNFGLHPEERALNFVATQPAAVAPAFHDAFRQGLRFQDIEVRPARQRQHSRDWWDVLFIFRAPVTAVSIADHVAAITVDVLDDIPVLVRAHPLWASSKTRNWRHRIEHSGHTPCAVSNVVGTLRVP